MPDDQSVKEDAWAVIANLRDQHPRVPNDCPTEYIVEALAAAGLLAAPQQARCASCEHAAEFHQPEGCWYTVANGKPGRDLVCPCEVSHAALAALREEQ